MLARSIRSTGTEFNKGKTGPPETTHQRTVASSELGEEELLQKWAEIFLKSVLLVSMDMGQIKGQPGERAKAQVRPLKRLPGTLRAAVT